MENKIYFRQKILYQLAIKKLKPAKNNFQKMENCRICLNFYKKLDKVKILQFFNFKQTKKSKI